jgi:hypothetical protein
MTSFSFSMAQVFLYKKSSLAAMINHGILSLPEGQHFRKLTRQAIIVLDTHRPSNSCNLGKAMQASTWSLLSIHLVIVLGKHPLGRCPSTYAAHANKIVSEPYQKEQCSSMQCQRLKQNESMKYQCD